MIYPLRSDNLLITITLTLMIVVVASGSDPPDTMEGGDTVHIQQPSSYG
jgi:hypothetical protein